MKFEDISYNFSVAKVIAILTVATGHFFEGIWWIPTTNALFVFAFSSGFFTSRKYVHGFSKKRFWYAKISRLIFPIVVIDIFLLSFFLVKQADSIFTWHTIPSLLGLNGFLGWFNIANSSPLGAGLWFFTLLIVFYLFYPLLSLLNKNQTYAFIFLILSLITTTVLHYTVHMGYMLWLTSFAFIFGSFVGRNNLRLPASLFLYVFASSYFLMFFLNVVLNFKILNYFFVLTSSISIVGYLLNKRLPNFIFENTLLLSGCIIEIYFIHTYLFFRPTKITFIDYGISILLITIVAYFLSKVADILKTLIYRNFQINLLNN